MKGNSGKEKTWETGSSKAVVSFLLAFLFGMGVLSAWAIDEIDSVKLRRDRLPEGWKLTNEFPIPEEKIEPFRTKFFAPIERMLYQSILVAGTGEIRINYASCPEEAQTATVYQKMIELVGNQNVVVRKGRVVVEIISKASPLKEAALERLPLSPLQKRKLRSTHIPPGWKLVSEFFLPQSDLGLFEKRFDVRLEEIVNQFLFVNQRRLRVNYLAVQREEDAEKAFEKMVDLTGKTNLILKKGAIVVEAITESPDMKADIASRLERFIR
jgi:hypothetical protein